MMAPLIDLLNHSFDDNADYEFEITPGQGLHLPGIITLTTNRPLAAGTRIFIKYGDRPNRELLALYGFVLPSNPFDYFYLRLHVPRDKRTAFRRHSTRRQTAIGADGVVASDFVRGVNWMLSGTADVTLAAYALIEQRLTLELAPLNAALQADAVAAQDSRQSQAAWSARAYVAVVQRALNTSVEHIRECIHVIKTSQPVPEFSGERRRDWNLRKVLLVVPGSENTGEEDDFDEFEDEDAELEEEAAEEERAEAEFRKSLQDTSPASPTPSTAPSADQGDAHDL